MPDIHLLVLIHGMWGNPLQLSELARVSRETHSIDESGEAMSLRVHVAESIKDESTYDGIDWGAERVAKEILTVVKDVESTGDRVARFSVTGFSLGGLIARYCVGILYQRKFFESVEPINFTAIASPHCGLPRYRSLFSCVKSVLGPKLMSRTGKQFYCVDNWSQTGRPLLEVMAEPNRIFYQALARFRHLNIYANAINDLTVPYVSAAIEVEDPFADYKRNGLELDVQGTLIKSFSLPDVPPPKPAMFTAGWFKKMKPSPAPAPLPQFPYNIPVYALVGTLSPFLFTYIISMFLLAGRSSRSRIQLLETEASGSDIKALLYMFHELEQTNELTVGSDAGKSDDLPSTNKYALESSKDTHPIITPTHRRIAGWLNTLPWEKELAFLPGVLSSHNIIICRDIQRFEWQRPGENVIRHWAHSLVV